MRSCATDTGITATPVTVSAPFAYGVRSASPVSPSASRRAAIDAASFLRGSAGMLRSLVQLRFHDDADRDDPTVQSFLARIPEVQALHAARGLTEEESWETLQDLPRHAYLDRLLHRTPGLRKDWWVELAYSGRLFQ